MFILDIDDICKRWWNANYPNNTLGAIHYSELSIKVDSRVEWSSQLPQTEYEGPTSIVRVERAQPDLGAYGSVNTSKNNEMVTSAEITKGALKNLRGVNSKVRLTLPDEISNQLGKTFELDLSQEISESRTNITVDARIGQEFPKNVASTQAEITTMDKEYKGTFDCTVKMEGPVVFSYAGDKEKMQDVGTIVGPYIANVEDITVQSRLGASSTRVRWNLKGVCKFCWVNTQLIKWT